MSRATEIAAVERQVRELERLPVVRDKVDKSIARADRVLDKARGGAASRRDLERLGRDVSDRLVRAAIAVALVSIGAIGIGLFVPLGLFGFLAAVGLAVALAALALFWPQTEPTMPAPEEKIDNAELVQRFDRYIHREQKALPPPARREIDALLTRLPELRKLMAKVSTDDPLAADARRLMGRHLPGLIERYEQVPAGYRDSHDNEGLSVDERLLDGLRSGRRALEDIGEELAKKDVAALETHGRFIKQRYGEKDPPLQ